MELRPILSALLRHKTAPLLIALQIALTLAIVCNAGYLIANRLGNAARPSGVDESSLFDIRFYPHRKIDDVVEMQRRDLQTLRALPGVQSVALSNQIPLGRSSWTSGGLTAERGQSTQIRSANYMSPDSLVDTFGLRLVEGRDFLPEEIDTFDPQKEQYHPRRAIVTLALARALFPDAQNFAGRSFYFGGGDESDQLQIVGVVERLQTPSAPADASAEYSLLLPVRSLDPYVRYVVRTEPALRNRVMTEAEQALLALRNDRVLLGKRSLDDWRALRYASENTLAILLIAVSAFLLLITASGIVGLASLWVNQRTKQIGVRRALGARRIDILRYFLVENLLITSTGIFAGLLLALLLNDLLVRELSVSRLPAPYIGSGMAIMWLLGLVAVLGPAIRATRVPPAVATR
ncbi:MAG TPA: FtsX-like permease family protein, partial [Arenimonas sp.]|nr:FtsX-like permease family protein [Arenimonas sp.]